MASTDRLLVFAAGVCASSICITLYQYLSKKWLLEEALDDCLQEDSLSRTPTRPYDGSRRSSMIIPETSPHPLGGASFRTMSEKSPAKELSAPSPVAPPVIVGVAGASGSGKTCIASLIEQRLVGVRVVSISSDNYYKGLKPGTNPAEVNFDHPESLDLDLLAKHLIDLREGRDVRVPEYNFSTHKRCPDEQFTFISARETDVVIVDGIFVLAVEKLRSAFDLTLFTVEDLDVCLVRRLRRDIAERGRSLESVLLQYMLFVRPGYVNFIEPSRSCADILVPRARDNHTAIEMVRLSI